MLDVVVIGGGQAGLATGYYLRRSGRTFAILDDQPSPGGAWRHTWESLTLFSPSQYSSLPGRMMSPWEPGFPPAKHVLEYLASYEDRYDLPIERRVFVSSVQREDDGTFTATAGDRRWRSTAIVNATGTFAQPYTPAVSGRKNFAGTQLHSSGYRSLEPFRGQRVAVVGGGNSGAQIAAELQGVADTHWFTLKPPRFMPDDVDGRVLFSVASARVRAVEAGGDDAGTGGLGDIVAVPSVRAARDAGILRAEPMFDRLTPSGVAWDAADDASSSTGHREGKLDVDVVVWCTGYRPALTHLAFLEEQLISLGTPLRDMRGHIRLDGLESVAARGLYFLGYGDWTGPGSATLVGAGRTARDLVRTLEHSLNRERS